MNIADIEINFQQVSLKPEFHRTSFAACNRPDQVLKTNWMVANWFDEDGEFKTIQIARTGKWFYTWGDFHLEGKEEDYAAAKEQAAIVAGVELVEN